MDSVGRRSDARRDDGVEDARSFRKRAAQLSLLLAFCLWSARSLYGRVGGAVESSAEKTRAVNITAARLDLSDIAPASTIGEPDPGQIPRVRFVPYPYNTLGSGADVQCQWETRQQLSGNLSAYDATQRAAFAEGVCIPPKLRSTIHVFSSAEAAECLRDIHLTISGDSYTKQLYIGLADILLAKRVRNDAEIKDSKQRNVVLVIARDVMKKRRERDPSFPDVRYLCETPCYGKRAPFSVECARCLHQQQSLGNSGGRYVHVVGAGIHIKNHFASKTRPTNDTVDATVREIDRFMQRMNDTIFVSMPSSQTEKVPEQYREANGVLDLVYEQLLQSVARQSPWLDVYELTRSCFMDNCSSDGNHRSRFVNRWKAQLLLNMLCEVHDG